MKKTSKPRPKQRRRKSPSEISGTTPLPQFRSPPPQYDTRRQPKRLRYFSDGKRHLVCWPYSEENLHRMAADLDLKRGWFHVGSGRGMGRTRNAHYDIPVRRRAELAAKTEAVTTREVLAIIGGDLPQRLR